MSKPFQNTWCIIFRDEEGGISQHVFEAPTQRAARAMTYRSLSDGVIEDVLPASEMDRDDLEYWGLVEPTILPAIQHAPGYHLDW